MAHLPITPIEAARSKPVSVEDKLYETVNDVLRHLFRGGEVKIFQEDVESAVGKNHWDVAKYPRALKGVMSSYAHVGWKVIEDPTDPYRPGWSLTPERLAWATD